MRAEGWLNAVDCHLKSLIHKKQPERQPEMQKERAQRKAVQRMALWVERKLELMALWEERKLELQLQLQFLVERRWRQA